MAAVVALTYDGDPDVLHGPQKVRKIILDWTSHTDGAASATTKKIAGRLLKAVTNPGATAPTASYDINITDPEGNDVLAGAVNNITNRHTSTTEEVYFAANIANVPGGGVVVCEPLTIAVTNAGDSKVGKLILYWTPDA